MSAIVVQVLSVGLASQAITAQGGNALIVGIGNTRTTSTAPGAPGDTVNTYTQRTAGVTAAGMQIALYDSIGIAGSGAQALTVSFTPGGVNSGQFIFLMEVSGILSYDTGSTGTASSGTVATGAVTLATPPEFVVGLGAASTVAQSNFTAGTGFAIDATHGNVGWGGAGAFSASIESGAFGSNFTPAFGNSDAVLWQMISAAYKVSAAAASGGHLTICGAG